MDFDWRLPYPSRRLPLLARNAVATSHPLAAQAGLRMMLRGGNAVDAAVACAIALTVVEPVSNGIGGDAFAMVWDGSGLHGLNASGRSPAAWTPQRFAGMDAMPERGWDTVTVPGAVSAWVELSRRFGRLPFPELFAPASDYAREGYAVAPDVARQWQIQADILAAQPGFTEAFLPGGRSPAAGEMFRFQEQAITLKRIAETGGDAFYRGDLAQRLADHAREHGGALAPEDLAAHRADWVQPLGMDYRGVVLHELPPNGQGLAALIALSILSRWNVGILPLDTAESVHLQLEAMKLAFADVYRHVADPQGMEVSPQALLDPGYLDQRARRIDPQRAQEFGHGLPPDSGTVYLAAADASGMMVSCIQSNYNGFGSGVVVPGTGIALHNRGRAFSLKAGHPNRVGPGRRPFHTIIPGFVTRGGQALMSFGVMGAAMQPQGHVQVMLRIFDYGQNPQAACDAPRWRVMEGLNVWIEPGFPEQTVEGLRRRGHRLALAKPPSLDFGAAQIIYRMDGGYLAASEPRRDGQAVGY
ncbi:MAG TPA: gamma-glutamyltransferase family protein [Burkholderiales bacterium]